MGPDGKEEIDSRVCGSGCRNQQDGSVEVGQGWRGRWEEAEHVLKMVKPW